MNDTTSRTRRRADAPTAARTSPRISPREAPISPREAPADDHGPARMPMLLSVFAEDASLVTRTRSLLDTIGACTLQRGGVDFDGAAQEADGGAGVASLVLVLVAPAQLPAACEALGRLRTHWPLVPLIVLGHGLGAAEFETLVAHDAFDFASTDAGDGELLLRVRRALGLLPPADATRTRPEASDPLACVRARLIGSAPEFMRLVRRVPVMAASDASMLLLGETGTGKEVCAQAIHYVSPRARGPWVAINCAAIPSELVEDELFGHVRGAYTHALEARHGLVREAEGGTLFLDEIDSMPLPAQAKLLRFLQDKQYRVVGSSTLRTADVRVVAASNRDLRLAASSGAFRADLFYRLNVLSLTLPPLRERREDIPTLALHFMDQANREAGRRLAGITPGALRCLLEHTWPGNVRELRHVLQRAVLLAQGRTLQASDIELDGVAPSAGDPLSFREAKARVVEAFERRYLEQLLAQSEGNISRAAKAAQKDRRAFFELLRRHAIDAASFRGRLG